MAVPRNPVYAGARRVVARNRAALTKRADKKISVLLVDDHPVVREGIKACLLRRGRIKVIGEASDGVEAIRRAKELSPDVVLMDISLPRMNGLEATRRLRRVAPRARVLILTIHENREYVRQMARCGAEGYLLKSASPAELVRALEAVDAGEAFFSPGVARVLLEESARAQEGRAAGLATLTAREREVLKLIAEGSKNREIAAWLKISVRTVETHREHIMQKLEIHTVAGLTKFALAHGLVDAE